MSVLKDVSMETIRKMPENATVKDIMYEIDLIGHVFEGLESSEESLGNIDENIIKKIEQCIEQSEYDKYIVVPLNDVFIKNNKVKLSRTAYLIVQFENKQFIVSYNDLGLLAVSDSLDSAMEDIKMQFSGLWDDYVTSPEEELARSGISFKNKLMSYVVNV
jgi:hypothetical protein